MAASRKPAAVRKMRRTWRAGRAYPPPEIMCERHRNPAVASVRKKAVDVVRHHKVGEARRRHAAERELFIEERRDLDDDRRSDHDRRAVEIVLLLASDKAVLLCGDAPHASTKGYVVFVFRPTRGKSGASLFPRKAVREAQVVEIGLRHVHGEENASRRLRRCAGWSCPRRRRRCADSGGRRSCASSASGGTVSRTVFTNALNFPRAMSAGRARPRGGIGGAAGRGHSGAG